MEIIKTTDYFKMTNEEAGKKINNYDTREEAKVLDAGLEHYFFSTYEGLMERLQSDSWKGYVNSRKWDQIVFEFVADNDNGNKYCIVLR